MWKSCEIVKSHYVHIFHIIFILFSHFGARDPGLGLGSGPQHVKIIWKYYEKNKNKWDFITSHVCHMLFILFSYFYNMFGLGTQIRAPKIIFLSYSWSYYFHIIFIFLDMPGLAPLSIPQSLKIQSAWWPSLPAKSSLGGQIQPGTLIQPGSSDPAALGHSRLIYAGHRQHLEAARGCFTFWPASPPATSFFSKYNTIGM